MIDIHCHILPNFDDGASSLEEALDMARMASYSGVTGIVATPHFRGEEDFLDQKEIIDLHFRELDAAIQKWSIPIQLYPGAEILCLPETPELAAQRQLPTIGNTNYVLTEFYFDESFAYMDGILSDIADYGYRPVVAHPERYDAIQRDPMLLERWARMGFVLQLNKGSILGSFGEWVEEAAHEILELGLVHLFASDAHSCYERTPHMGELQQWVEEFCDPDCARILLEENPRRLLLGQSMTGEDW